jgi:DNA-binding NarL/FixJ family response regulator
MGVPVRFSKQLVVTGRPKGLTHVQLKLVKYLCLGMSTKEIAFVCGVSQESVRTTVITACGRVGVRDKASLMLWGFRYGGFEVPDMEEVGGGTKV